MVENGLTEVEISDKDTRVRVVRGGAAVSAMAPVAMAAPVPVSSAMESSATHAGAVTSPMVGVVYLSPEPGAPHFVSVGQQVTVGQTLLLIEAMKTFNQIKAASAGIVTKIIVQNSAPVEYGELLMIVE